MKKKALITGIAGQDGTYLTELLLNKGYEVHGLVRNTSNNAPFPNQYLSEHISKEALDVTLHYGNIGNTASIIRLLDTIQPDEIYNFAAQSNVQDSFIHPEECAVSDGMGVLRLLEALRITGLISHTRFFQPSSSDLFGEPKEIPQTEHTPFYPRSPYGVAKLYGHWITVNYRESYSLFACNGLMYNHESPLRHEKYISRKISKAIARIHLGLQDCLYVGNLDIERDWGYAKDYVYAMYLMLQQDKADDYIISSGVGHSIKDMIDIACKYVHIDIEWVGEDKKRVGIDTRTKKEIVKIDPKLYRLMDTNHSIGDNTKAKRILQWHPSVNFETLVQTMLEYDIAQLQSH